MAQFFDRDSFRGLGVRTVVCMFMVGDASAVDATKTRVFFAGQPGKRRLGTSEKQKKNKGNLANCLKVPTLLGVENFEGKK